MEGSRDIVRSLPVPGIAGTVRSDAIVFRRELLGLGSYSSAWETRVLVDLCKGVGASVWVGSPGVIDSLRRLGCRVSAGTFRESEGPATAKLNQFDKYLNQIRGR